MSLRLRIAKWLAPELVEKAGNLADATERMSRNYRFMLDRHDQLLLAVRSIAALRTPKCASIGKRMADIAEEALK